MMLTRPPGPRSELRFVLLIGVYDGCEGFSIRRIGRLYGMAWRHAGTRLEGVPPHPGYVPKFVAILNEFAHGPSGRGSRIARHLRRLSAATERGSFDFPVGPEYVVGVRYRAEWRRGRVEELDIELGDCAALSASGIAKAEYDFAWYEPLSE